MSRTKQRGPNVRVWEQEAPTSIVNVYVSLPDGRTINLFVNRDSRLVCLDIVDADERGGNEVYRRVV